MKQPKKKSVERFPGLSLKEEERRALAAMRAGRKRLSIRRWRRIRILELLDKGWTMQDTADAAGTFPREVRRVGRRYLQRGLEAALSEDPRPKPPKFDARSEAAVVAIACSPPGGRCSKTLGLQRLGGGDGRHGGPHPSGKRCRLRHRRGARVDGGRWSQPRGPKGRSPDVAAKHVGRLCGRCRFGAGSEFMSGGGDPVSMPTQTDAGTVTVGRWMSPGELKAMQDSGTVQESTTGTTHVPSPASSAAFGKQAKSGSVYAQCDVPSGSVSLLPLALPRLLVREVWKLLACSFHHAFGARYENPKYSLWSSPDPILASYMERGAASPSNLAPYSYTWNNPVVLRDPDGRQVVPPMVESFEPYETERKPIRENSGDARGPRRPRRADCPGDQQLRCRVARRASDRRSMNASEPGFEPIGRTPEEDARHMSIAPPPEPQEANQRTGAWCGRGNLSDLHQDEP